MYIIYDLPSKKISLQKYLDLYFMNLTLQTREARGMPVNAWFSLAQAKEKIGKMDLDLIMECLLKNVRTYFSKNI